MSEIVEELFVVIAVDLQAAVDGPIGEIDIHGAVCGCAVNVDAGAVLCGSVVGLLKAPNPSGFRFRYTLLSIAH